MLQLDIWESIQQAHYTLLTLVDIKASDLLIILLQYSFLSTPQLRFNQQLEDE